MPSQRQLQSSADIVVVGSGIVLLILTFRSGRDEALEASTYDANGETSDGARTLDTTDRA